VLKVQQHSVGGKNATAQACALRGHKRQGEHERHRPNKQMSIDREKRPVRREVCQPVKWPMTFMFLQGNNRERRPDDKARIFGDHRRESDTINGHT